MGQLQTLFIISVSAIESFLYSKSLGFNPNKESIIASGGAGTKDGRTIYSILSLQRRGL